VVSVVSKATKLFLYYIIFIPKFISTNDIIYIMEKLQTDKNNNLFNGIHYLEGDDIYIFNDGIQESEKSSKTIIISNSSNNYIIEIFNNKFVYDCVADPDLVLGCVLQNNKLVSNENNNTHTFYYEDNDKLVYKYEKQIDKNDNYQELGLFTGSIFI